MCEALGNQRKRHGELPNSTDVENGYKVTMVTK